MNHGKRLLLLPTILASFVISLFAICLFAYLVIPKVLAQEENYDVTVSPVFFDLSANPGASVSENVRVRNNTNSPISISVEVNKLTGDETGALTITEENDDASSLDWFSFEQEEYTLSPLEWTNIPFTITVPETAAYGYYYTINFSQAGVEETGETGATITGAAAVPVLLNVESDNAIVEGNITNFTTTSGFYEYLPVTFTTTFENTGNVHVRPRGNIFIKDWLGREVAQLEVNEGNGAVLPNTKRDYESVWDDSFVVRVPKIEDGQVVMDENGNPRTELKFQFDKILDLRIGRYTAEEVLVISTSERDISYTAQTSFFVFPWKIVLGVVIFIVFAGIGLFSTFKKFFKKIFGIFRKK
jgi:hypothetical protein